MAKLLQFGSVRRKNAADCLEQLYRKNYKKLCAAARAILHDEHLAQDAVQEAWLRLSRPATLDGIDTSDPGRVLGMLLVTVRNTARNMIRTSAKEQTLPGEDWAALDAADPAPTPQSSAERRETTAVLRAALHSLPELDQAILQLQYDNGCTTRQIAALLDMSESAVRMHAYRARQRLKEHLEAEGMIYE